MKKLFVSFAFLLMGVSAFSQQVRELDEMSKDNSWLKVGVNLGVPVGNYGNYSSAAMGVDLAGQFMRTDNFGLGIATGYTRYFEKDNPDFVVNAKQGFGVIPLGLMFRYYPQPEGVFVGVDGGYSFVTGNNFTKGGAYWRPQLGYHNYDWNIFAFYNQIFESSPVSDIQSIGVAVTYNIRFK